tara:strand:- start:10974 stop:11378 length:405 start_codon:yes stop_codon:yes gene_type:complete
MSLTQDIFYLNKRHSSIISTFLDDIEELVNEVSCYNEDLVGFDVIMKSIIDFHNGLGEYVLYGSIGSQEWYVSLPNNLYWATKGYLANLELNQDNDMSLCEEKLLSLTVDVLKQLNNSIIIQPFNEEEQKINLN